MDGPPFLKEVRPSLVDQDNQRVSMVGGGQDIPDQLVSRNLISRTREAVEIEMFLNKQFINRASELLLESNSRTFAVLSAGSA